QALVNPLCVFRRQHITDMGISLLRKTFESRLAIQGRTQMEAHFLPLRALAADDPARTEANAGEYPAMATRRQSVPPRISISVLAFAVIALMLAETPLASPRFERPAGVAEANELLIAAGYRALFTCSAHFFAGRELQDIERVELVDTAPLRLPAPEIDETRQLVSAADGAGNVQFAAYRDSMGCTLLPPHWDEEDLPRLPYVA